MRKTSLAKIILAISIVLLVFIIVKVVQASDRITQFEAKRCVVDLMNNGEFSLGICVGEEIEGQPGYFKTDPLGGKFHFILWQDKVRLVGLEPPADFPIARPSENSSSAVRRLFLKANFPEIKEWKKQDMEITDTEKGQYITYTYIDTESIFRFQITIWYKTNRVVAIKWLSIPNISSQS